MPRGRDRRAGQAGVEHLGIVLAVAALVGLVGAFVAREIRPPAHPPTFVDSAARPLDRADDPGGALGELLVAKRLSDQIRTPRGRAPIGRALRRAAHAVAVANALGSEGLRTAAFGFQERLVERGQAFVEDPVGTALRELRATIRAGARPDATARAGAAAAIDYVEELGRMPPREAYLRLMHDIGTTGADALIDRGRSTAARALLRRLRARIAARRPVGDRHAGGRDSSHTGVAP